MAHLNDTEKYLFSLTGSQAESLSGQRAAIKREGYDGYANLSPARARQQVEAAKRKAEREQNAALKAKLRARVKAQPDVPVWLLAVRYTSPTTEPRGKLIDSVPLARLAYDIAHERNRRLKLSRGTSQAFPEVDETDNGKYGWDKVVWRYAHYTCCVSPNGKQVAIQLSASSELFVKSLYRNRIMWAGEPLQLWPNPAEVKANVKPRHLIRALNNHSHGISWSWDRTQKQPVATYRSEQYHCNVERGREQNTETYVRLNRKAVEAFRKRRDEQIQLDKLNLQAARTFVALEDSLRAGNCESMSKSFARDAWQTIGAQGECAVRADIVLSLRNDSYTRRAVNAAIERS